MRIVWEDFFESQSIEKHLFSRKPTVSTFKRRQRIIDFATAEAKLEKYFCFQVLLGGLSI